MKQHHQSLAVRPLVACLLCVLAFLFGISFNFGGTSTPSPPVDHTSPTAHLGGSSSLLQRAGLAERCSKVDIDHQVELFKAATAGGRSSCPEFNYLLDLELFVGLEPVVFDVGCNKGYDSAMLFEAFASQEEFSRVSLGKFYESHKGLNAQMSTMNGGTCGVCNDCKEVFASSSMRLRPPPGRRLQVHCFEPSATNYKALSEMHRHFFRSANRTAKGNELLLYNAAMSNTTGMVSMPSNCGELCQIQTKSDSATAASNSSSSAATTMVPLTTVDAMVESLQLQRLFMLKIDTEGFDPLVLLGARRTLAGHRVDLVLFEYNRGGVWGKDGFTLKAVTAELEAFGYICYFEGKLLTRITGCWSDALEVESWSNIICVAASRPVQAVLRAYSMVPFKGRY